MMPAESLQKTIGSEVAIHSALEEIRAKSRTFPASGGVTAVRYEPARAARLAPFPEDLCRQVREILRARGIDQLYSHQALSFSLATEGHNVVMVTPTASGKTLGYNLPILNALVQYPDARALYLFPTKALAQDQLAELNLWSERLNEQLRVFTYDGDTPQDARKAIRARANLVLTNPDMLHAGILPHHTRWERLFQNLRFVVIDELHYYRGVLGSHLANVLRRLKRVAAFYGSQPQFLCASATIANPAALASAIIEAPVKLVDDNGAPAAEKCFVFYNPPVVNPQLGIRRSYLNETRRLARVFLSRSLGTIVFANSRLAAEVLVTYLKSDFPAAIPGGEVIRAYRGGYLPLERRKIERDLREGRLLGVVATNALELGIDIGSLDVAVLAGYPGSIASSLQRAGRAGRRSGSSAALLVASSAPVDQFIVQHPDYFFGSSPEHGHVNPDNLQILLNHLKCAAFELPLLEGEKFGSYDLDTLCSFLEEGGFLHRSAEGWHWVSESYPADAISLRSVSSDNFVIVDTTSAPRVIGESDFTAALGALHEGAIYLQDGAQFHVERLDYGDRKAYVHRVESEYFTDAIDYTKITILERFDSAPAGAALRNHGEVRVNTQVVGFKKIKFGTMENVGSGTLNLPEQEMHTTAYWLTLPQALLATLPYASTEKVDGVNGLAHAVRAIATLLVMSDARDLGVAVGENPVPENSDLGVRDSGLGTRESGIGFREFMTPSPPAPLPQGGEGRTSFGNRGVDFANTRPCSSAAPANDENEPEPTPFSWAGPQPDGVPSPEWRVTNPETQILNPETRAPSPKSQFPSRESRVPNPGSRVADIRSRIPKPESRTPVVFFEPNIYLYDKYPGGVGLSEPLFRLSAQLVEDVQRLIASCPCDAGCPSCVGPVGEIGDKGKEVALAILRSLRGADDRSHIE